MNTTDRVPWLLIRNTLLILMLLGMAYRFYTREPQNLEAAGLCMTNAIALLMHSGRSRRAKPLLGAGGPACVVPLLCAASLALGACRVEGPIEARWPWGPELSGPSCRERPLRERGFGALGGVGADFVQMVPQSSNPIAAGTVGMWARSSTGRAQFTDASGNVLEIGEARKLYQSAGAPGSAVEGDIWYDTTAHGLAYKDNVGNQAIPGASNICTLSGSQTITGAKVINANLSTTDNTYHYGDATHRLAYMGLVEARSGSSSFTVTSAVADGATAKAAIINASAGLSTAGAKVVDFQVSGSSVGGVHYDGSYIGPKAGTSATALHAFPTGTGDLVSADATQTLTNKTLTSPTINSPAFGANSVILDTIHGAIAGGLGAATVYLGGIGVAASSTEYPLRIVRRAGTVRNLYCYLSTAPGGSDTVDFTVRKNGSDQSATCQIAAAATTCNDTSHTFSVVAGDRISIKAVSSAGTAAGAACSTEESN